jgi:hypothetical protein
MTTSDVRNGMIHQAQQERITRDTIIMQKVNAAHREAFKTRFPGQVEHCMRLTAERLQAILTRKPADLADPETWTSTADEIAKLSEALWHLSVISQVFPMPEENSDEEHSK